MTEEKKSGWGGRREPGPGKRLGRPKNVDSNLPEAKRTQFRLYPADKATLEKLAPDDASALVRGLIRHAETLPPEQIAELVELGKAAR